MHVLGHMFINILLMVCSIQNVCRPLFYYNEKFSQISLKIILPEEFFQPHPYQSYFPVAHRLSKPSKICFFLSLNILNSVPFTSATVNATSTPIKQRGYQLVLLFDTIQTNILLIIKYI